MASELDHGALDERARWLAEQLTKIAERAERGHADEYDAGLVDGMWSGLIGTDGARAARMQVLVALDAAHQGSMLNALVRQHRGQELTKVERALLLDDRGCSRGWAEQLAAMQARGMVGEVTDTLEGRMESVRRSLPTMLGVRLTDEQTETWGEGRYSETRKRAG